MPTQQAIIECGDFFIASILHRFPGSVVSMVFTVKMRPGIESLSHVIEDYDEILRGTWLIGVGSSCKNGKEIDDYAHDLAERIFFTHGVFIQHLIVEENIDGD